MSRLADADFERVLAFVSGYSLTSQAIDVPYVSAMRRVHKRHLALLTIWAGIAETASDGREVCFGTSNVASRDMLNVLEQSVADLSESFFCALHGAYKAAHALLRSSLENYVRALTSLTEPSALALTSVYQLFDLARQQEFFRESSTVPAIDIARARYSSLCEIVHSGVVAHGAPVRALAHFPVCHTDSLNRWADIFSDVARTIAESVIVSEPALFARLHFRERDLIGEVVSSEASRRLHQAIA